jgi:hypothetical protein
MAKSPHRPEHVDVEEYEDSPPGENTAPGAFTDIIVTVPESIIIRMVNAAALEDYEIWFFISSLLASVVTGFAVAYLQAVDAKSVSTTYIGWTLVVFILLFVIAFVTGLRKRMSMRRRGREIRLRVTRASERKDQAS